MKYFDADGNEVTGFSQEELDAKIKEVQEAAAAEAKKAADEAAAAANADKNNDSEMPAWFKPFADKIGALDSTNKSTTISRVTSGLDADKRKEVEAKFETLGGYADTPEAQSRRAEDAYLLVTGSRYDAGVMNMQNIAAAGGAGKVADSPEAKAVDQTIQAALGITPEDVEKFGKK